VDYNVSSPNECVWNAELSFMFTMIGDTIYGK